MKDPTRIRLLSILNGLHNDPVQDRVQAVPSRTRSNYFIKVEELYVGGGIGKLWKLQNDRLHPSTRTHLKNLSSKCTPYIGIINILSTTTPLLCMVLLT